MASDPGSDWADLDGSTPLTERERKIIRALILDHERQAWAWKRFKVFVPWAVSLVGIAWGLVEWFGKYFELRGRP